MGPSPWHTATWLTLTRKLMPLLMLPTHFGTESASWIRFQIVWVSSDRRDAWCEVNNTWIRM
jgi:hypothetical protein